MIFGSGINKRDKGKNIFHLKFINMSYRNRGRVPRIHRRVIIIMIMIIVDSIELIDLKNIMIVIILRINILVYSAKKIKANHPPIYSTLKPDTNSDSPSAKSKGLRFVSAKQEVIHIINIMRLPQKNIIIDCDNEISVSE